jgi:hypothetical protein
MSLSRRDFLKLGSLTAVTTTATACSLIGREVAQRELTDVDTAVTLSTTNDPIRRLLNRAGYGPRPGDVERIVAMGFAASADVVLNALARQQQPEAPAPIITPERLELGTPPLADCSRYDVLLGRPPHAAQLEVA